MYLNVWIFALGLQKEGAVGLLKGTGKGLVGLLVRPTGGLVDLASGTLSFVSRYYND
jgi:vacuolar protein sorting-associated protein 13A/C